MLSLGWIQGLKVVQLYLFTEPFSWEQTLAVLYTELKHAQQRTTISIQDILYARERKCRPIRVRLELVRPSEEGVCASVHSFVCVTKIIF